MRRVLCCGNIDRQRKECVIKRHATAAVRTSAVLFSYFLYDHTHHRSKWLNFFFVGWKTTCTQHNTHKAVFSFVHKMKWRLLCMHSCNTTTIIVVRGEKHRRCYFSPLGTTIDDDDDKAPLQKNIRNEMKRWNKRKWWLPYIFGCFHLILNYYVAYFILLRC